MPELVVSQKIFAWNKVEMRNLATGEIVLCTESKGLWLPGFLVYSKKHGIKEPSFTIKCRSVFPVTYQVLDVAGQDIGALTLEHWLAPIWRICDSLNNSVSYTVRTGFFPSAAYEVKSEGRLICNIRQSSNLWITETFLSYPETEASPVSEPLILTLAILLSRPANGGAAG